MDLACCITLYQEPHTGRLGLASPMSMQHLSYQLLSAHLFCSICSPPRLPASTAHIMVPLGAHFPCSRRSTLHCKCKQTEACTAATAWVLSTHVLELGGLIVRRADYASLVANRYVAVSSLEWSRLVCAGNCVSCTSTGNNLSKPII